MLLQLLLLLPGRTRTSCFHGSLVINNRTIIQLMLTVHLHHQLQHRQRLLLLRNHRPSSATLVYVVIVVVVVVVIVVVVVVVVVAAFRNDRSVRYNVDMMI